MVVTACLVERYQVKITAGMHTFLSDEPVSVGGDGTGAEPYELLLGGLAACKIITMQMYAERKGWRLDDVVVNLSHRRVAARDCEGCTSEPDAQVDVIECDLTIEGDLDEAQRERLKVISERCPVQRTLTSETKIVTRLVEEV